MGAPHVCRAAHPALQIVHARPVCLGSDTMQYRVRAMFVRQTASSAVPARDAKCVV